MSEIDIRRSHALGVKQAKQRVEKVAEHIAEKFDIDYEWDGNALRFTRSGVDGRIGVGVKDIHVTATLGFLLGWLKDPIEKEIRRYLDEEFG